LGAPNVVVDVDEPAPNRFPPVGGVVVVVYPPNKASSGLAFCGFGASFYV
jgi:hypothetical protein